MTRQRISGQELWLMLVGFMFGASSLLTPGGLAEHETWLAITIAIGPSIAVVILYAWLAQRFARQTMVEIARVVYGPALGTIIAGLYVIYVFHLGSLVITTFGDFFTTMVFTKTPEWVLLAVFVALAGYATGSGLEAFARTATILTVSMLTLVPVETIAIFAGRVELKHLMPFFETPLPKLLWAAWTAFAFPFADTVAFLMILPSLHRPREGCRWLVRAVSFMGLLFVVIAVRNAIFLGRSLSTFPYPSFEALRMINIGDFLTRFEVGIAVLFIAAGFIKLSVLYYGSAVGFAQLLRLKDYRTLIAPMGVLLVLFGIHNFGSVIEIGDFANQVYPLWAGIFQIVIPVTTAIVAKARHLPKGGTGQSARPQ